MTGESTCVKAASQIVGDLGKVLVHATSTAKPKIAFNGIDHSHEQGSIDLDITWIGSSVFAQLE